MNNKRWFSIQLITVEATSRLYEHLKTKHSSQVEYLRQHKYGIYFLANIYFFQDLWNSICADQVGAAKELKSIFLCEETEDELFPSVQLEESL